MITEIEYDKLKEIDIVLDSKKNEFKIMFFGNTAIVLKSMENGKEKAVKYNDFLDKFFHKKTGMTPVEIFKKLSTMDLSNEEVWFIQMVKQFNTKLKKRKA